MECQDGDAGRWQSQQTSRVFDWDPTISPIMDEPASLVSGVVSHLNKSKDTPDLKYSFKMRENPQFQGIREKHIHKIILSETNIPPTKNNALTYYRQWNMRYPNTQMDQAHESWRAIFIEPPNSWTNSSSCQRRPGDVGWIVPWSWDSKRYYL